MHERKGPRIVVCVKQVPIAAAVEFDEETGRLQREDIPAEVNSDDIRALLAAIDIRQRWGGQVVAITMGPPAASGALTYCLALGADNAIHLCDKAFAGSDTLATARALALAIQREPADLVLCGRSSTDAETGNVGPEIAELLDLPQVTGVSNLDVEGAAEALLARRDTDDGVEHVRVPTPALLVVGEDVADERFPSKEAKAVADSLPITRLGVAALGGDPSRFGGAGSPTTVAEVVRRTPAERENILVDDEDVDQQADTIAEWLAPRANSGAARGQPERPTPAEQTRLEASRICVYVEFGMHGLRQVSRELLAAAAELAHALPAQVDALLVGQDVQGYAREVWAYGADRVLLAEDPRLAAYDTARYTHVVTAVLDEYQPDMVLFPSTVLGRDLAPRCAARRGLGLTADCVGLHVSDGRLVQHKPAFGDGLTAMITTRTKPEFASVRPGIVSALNPRWTRQGPTEWLSLTDLPEPSTTVVAHEDVDTDSPELAAADIVVGVGTGAVPALAEIDELAGVLGASIGCTRKVADAGALPRRTQIGLTGQSISPQIYIALGIRGAYEHVVGVHDARHVLAIDVDEDSIMFDHADLGVVQDCKLLLPVLLERLRRNRIHTQALGRTKCTPA